MLDSIDRVKSIDRKDMVGSLEHMSRDLVEGIRRGRMTGLPRFVPQNIFVCGMGGSAIGGDLLCEWFSSISEIPCNIMRSYSIPPYLGKDSLVIVASYSGNTEETLSMFEEARKRRAKLVAVTSGGELAQMTGTYDVPLAKLPTGMMPRASLGYMFGAMLGILERTGSVASDKQFEEAARILDSVAASCKPSVQTAENPAKRLAHELFGFVPVVVGYGLSRPVAKRWANQLNENSKSLAFSSEIPELDHNEIVGWMKDRLSKGFAAVILDIDQGNKALVKRVEATKNMLARVAPVHRVKSVGMSPLAQMMSLVLTGDYVSVYLGILRSEDPSSNEPIDELKSILAKK
jgi:glucose/mannose-6-phosphate isomerase